MIPTSRCLGGVTRTRDLRTVTRSSSAHVESLKVDQSLFLNTPTHSVLERAAGPSRASDRPQVLPEFKSLGLSVDPVEATAPLGEISPATPPRTDVHLYSGARRHIGNPLLARSTPQPSFASQQLRNFHTTSCVPYDSTSYNVIDVPDFFVKYKQYRTTSSDLGVPENKHEESGLMHSLTNSILSGDVVATTRRLRAKIPVEHHIAEGHIVHPSGFVVPGPGHTSTSDVARAKERKRNENKDRLVQTAAVAHCVLESDMEQVAATTLPASHKVPFEVYEADGTVKHPSGFVPPTPAHKFKYAVSSNVLWERKVSAVRQKIRQPSPSRAVLRAVHTTSAPKTPGDV